MVRALPFLIAALLVAPVASGEYPGTNSTDKFFSGDGTWQTPVSVGPIGSWLMSDGSAYYWASATNTMILCEEWGENNASGTAVSRYQWSTANNGTGAGTDMQAGQDGHPGILEMRTGTQATGRTSNGLKLTGMLVTNGLIYGAITINIPVLSDGSQTWIGRYGLGDVQTATDFTDGVYFEYDSASSANWRCKTAASSSRETTTTGTAVATGWATLAFKASYGTQVLFYVNGTVVATNTTQIPGGAGRQTGLMLNLQSTVGTTDKTNQFDQFYLWQKFERSR